MLLSRRLATPPAIMLLAALLIRCGAGDGPGVFPFTPVPYTAFPEPQCESISCSRSYYLTEACEWNAADQVQLVIRAEERNAFVSWISGYGFIVAEEYDRRDDNTVFMLLFIPPGSVPQAIARIQERQGVQFVSPNPLLFPPESEPLFIQDCRKTREAGE